MKNVKIRLPFYGNYPITQKFGENPEIYKRFGKPGHNGVDFGLPHGTPVLAAANGYVSRIGFEKDGYGNYIKLQHEGFETLYAHLSMIGVEMGKNVQKGQQIGYSGQSGFSTGAHLHFELRIPNAPGAYNRGEVDPLPFLEAVEPTVKPIEANKFYRVIVPSLNVRIKPMDRVIGQLAFGDRVKTVEKVDQWVGIVLYVHSDFLELDE